MEKLIRKNRRLLSIYRFVNEVVDLKRLVYFIPNYIRYFKSFYTYLRINDNSTLQRYELYPQIHDRTGITPFDPHYFYQGYWAFKRILQSEVKEHTDVGSQIDLARYLSVIMNVTFVDIRPLQVSLDNFESKDGSILSLPYADNSIRSLSSLHVIEHIGLGRYGDPIDLYGSEKAANELTRVMAPGGHLYLSTPIGRPRTCFNAHRIRTSHQVVALFPALSMVEFSVIDDEGNFKTNALMESYTNSDYSCGLFIFQKPKNK